MQKQAANTSLHCRLVLLTSRFVLAHVLAISPRFTITNYTYRIKVSQKHYQAGLGDAIVDVDAEVL